MSPPEQRAGHRTAPLALAELVRVEPLASGEVAVLPDPGRRVLRVELAETFDRLARTPAHSVVVLHAQAATGGWSLAAALHVAWERGVAGVVVPRSAMSAASAVLAERLGIALVVVDADAVDVALELAARTAAPEAARALRVAQCAEELAGQSTIRGVLGVLNTELAPVSVALVTGASLLAGRAGAAQQRDGYREVRVAVNGFSGRAWASLVASVPEPESAVAGELEVRSTESVLRLARLPLLAAWAQSRMDTSAQAAQERAAFRVLRDLAEARGPRPADPAGASAGAFDGAGADALEGPGWSAELGWRVSGHNRALWVQPAGSTTDSSTDSSAESSAQSSTELSAEPSAELTQLLRAQWARLRPGWPFVPEGGGWVSWHNSADQLGPGSLRRALGPVLPLLADHGLVLGVGRSHEGVTGLVRSVDEARLAARVGPGPDLVPPVGAVGWFEEVGVRAVLAQVPVGDVADVAALVLPDLVGARDREVLVTTALAVLDCGGSLAAASARLGVHRNTVLARVVRARELGLSGDDPAERLAVHVACHALVRAWSAPAPRAQAVTSTP